MNCISRLTAIINIFVKYTTKYHHSTIQQTAYCLKYIFLSGVYCSLLTSLEIIDAEAIYIHRVHDNSTLENGVIISTTVETTGRNILVTALDKPGKLIEKLSAKSLYYLEYAGNLAIIVQEKFEVALSE